MKATILAPTSVVVSIGEQQYVRILSQRTCVGCAFRHTWECGVLPCGADIGPDENHLDWIFVAVK